VECRPMNDGYRSKFLGTNRQGGELPESIAVLLKYSVTSISTVARGAIAQINSCLFNLL